MNTDSKQFIEVNKAFTLQSNNYDKYDEGNHILTWMRKLVRAHALLFLRPGDKILELNSGTGIDAVFFAEKGFDVHCTDLSDGMIEQIKRKIEKLKQPGKITFQQCSYTELNKIKGKKFDFIFSNFGGLNCIPDLKEVTKFFPSLLNNNGRICFVILPPLCPWELIQILRGKFSFALRRFGKNGTLANVEGINFRTYYFSAGNVKRALGVNFKIISKQGLGIFTPSPQMEKIPKNFPRFTKALNRIDETISGVFPFNRIGDHIMITAEYETKE
jgi:ubiquinone/menaquinone biosynthesis C-methylase UbiE